MNSIESEIRQAIYNAINKLGVNFPLEQINIDHAKDKSHGDYSSNIAFKINRFLGPTPLITAQKIIEVIVKSKFTKIEAAAPGFINFFLVSNSIASVIDIIVKVDNNYGRDEIKNKKINVEFVSANPTGNLHVGHARCAAYGDSLSRILSFAGYDVTREYYINDAGNQIHNLGVSIYQRYRELFGKECVIPPDGYMGEDVKNIASFFKNKYGDSLLEDCEKNIKLFCQEGSKLELEQIKKDLNYFRISFDVYSSETSIRNSGAIDKVLNEVSKYIYVSDGAKLLKTTSFLDDKDRPIIKSNGDYTYFLPDIAYHFDKMSRGFDYLIDVLGADHHGYVNRMKSALMMKGYTSDTLTVPLIQVVRLMNDGIEVKMSKRTGNAITLRELCDEVGVDAVRYFFVMRSHTSHFDFDFGLAKSKSNDNPVYYAMYAHARLCKVLSLSKGIDISYAGQGLDTQIEIDLMKKIQEFPNVVSSIAKSFEVHKLTLFINSLATLIHSFYNECRIIDKDNLFLTSNRLGLAKACKITLRNALQLIGVNAPEQM